MFIAPSSLAILLPSRANESTFEMLNTNTVPMCNRDTGDAGKQLEKPLQSAHVP